MPTSFRSSIVTIAAVAILASGALGVRAPALADAPAGAPVDGIRCDQMEGSVFHIHQHLAIVDHGKAVTIPADIGRPVVAQCLYWIHTHTSDGIIHVESPVFKTFTLGQFFDVWGQPLSATSVAGAKAAKGQIKVYVNGAPYKGNPRSIELAQHTDIAIDVGPPFRTPATFTEWNGN
jgi:hypothetical protein